MVCETKLLGTQAEPGSTRTTGSWNKFYQIRNKAGPGLVNFVPGVTRHICLEMPAAFPQPALYWAPLYGSRVVARMLQTN